MRPSTLGQWWAMHEIDPWDENRSDWRFAELARVVLGAMGAKKEDGSRFEASDFMLYAKAQYEPEVIAQQEQERVELNIREGLRAFSGHKAKNYQHIIEDD